MNTDNEFMLRAIKLAKEAANDGEIPVGAVIVRENIIVGEGRNRREKDRNSLAHAEVIAINEACKKLNNWRLDGCELYVTLEPCPMCAGAVINSRISKVYYGASDKDGGAMGSLINLAAIPFRHNPRISAGLMQNECAKLLSDFFETLRKNK